MGPGAAELRQRKQPLLAVAGSRTVRAADWPPGGSRDQGAAAPARASTRPGFHDPIGEPYTIGDLEALLRLRCDRVDIAPVTWSWLRTNGLILGIGERPWVTTTL